MQEKSVVAQDEDPGREKDVFAPPKREVRRQALRDFQQQLLERTQLARSDKNGQSMRLAVRAGDACLLLDVAHATEVMPYESITRVPHTCDWFLGLINCRGKLSAVIDFPGWMGQPVAPWHETDRLLVLSDTLPAPCALRVTRVPVLINVCAFTLQPRPEDAPIWVSAIYTDRDAQSWRLLDLSLLVSDSAFLDVIVK